MTAGIQNPPETPQKFLLFRHPCSRHGAWGSGTGLNSTRTTDCLVHPLISLSEFFSAFRANCELAIREPKEPEHSAVNGCFPEIYATRFLLAKFSPFLFLLKQR